MFAQIPAAPVNFAQRERTLSPYEQQASDEFVKLLHPRAQKLDDIVDGADQPVTLALRCFERTHSCQGENAFQLDIAAPCDSNWGITGIKLELRCYFNARQMGRHPLLESQWASAVRYSGLGPTKVSLGNCELFSCPGGAFFGFCDQFAGQEAELHVQRMAARDSDKFRRGPELCAVWSLPCGFSSKTPLLLNKSHKLSLEFEINVEQLERAGFVVDGVNAHVNYCEPIGTPLSQVRYCNLEQTVFLEKNAFESRFMLPLPEGRVRRVWFALLNENRECTASEFSQVGLFNESEGQLFLVSDRALYDAMRQRGCVCNQKGYGELDFGGDLELAAGSQLCVDFGTSQQDKPIQRAPQHLADGYVSDGLASMLDTMSNNRYGVMTGPRVAGMSRLQVCCFRPRKLEINLETGAITSGTVANETQAETQAKTWWSLW
jgi:hypothetical protein